MKQFLCVICFMCASVWVRAIDREAFSITKYDLDVRVEPEQQRLGVRGKITLRNDSAASQRSLSLQISSSLNWSSITLAGKPVEFLTQSYISDIDHTAALSEAIVVLPQPVAPRQSVELEVGYEGVIPQDATRLTRIGVPADQAKHSDWDEIGRSFTAVRGIGYVAWYPIATEAATLSDDDSVVDAVDRWKRRETQAEMKARFTHLTGSAESPPEIICNGAETSRMTPEAAAAQMQTVDCSFNELGTTVPVFAMAQFLQLERDAVTIHFLSEHKSAAEDYAAATEEVIPLITKWFGDHREKAETKAEVVDLPDAQAASYESGRMLLMPLADNDTKLLLAAAQQFTQVVFPSPTAWIRDGLAAYARVRLIEEKEGRQAAVQYLQAHQGALLELEKAADANNRAESTSLFDAKDEFRLQTKTMYIWWMLRDTVGEASLDAALHEYKADADRDPTYMQKLIEAQAHRDLQWFFNDWVYKDRGLPDFRIASVFPNPLPTGGYLVTVTVENLGGAGAEIPVTLHMQSGEASGRLIVPGKSKAAIRVQVPSMPQTVTVNDGSVPQTDANNNQYQLDH